MTPPPRRPLVTALGRIALRQYGLVTRAQALAAGCSDRVMQRLCRDGTLERLERGVYRLSGVPRSFEQRVLAACLSCPGSVACRLTAVLLYGFELPRRHEDVPLELLCRGHRRPTRDARYRVHSSAVLQGSEVTVRRGIPVTAPGRTLQDVAPLLPASVLDRFVGHLLASRELTVVQLGRLVTAGGGNRRQGQGALRAAVERAGMTVAPDSVLEHRALLLLRAAGLPEPVTHFRVHTRGRLIAEVDFAWPDGGVILEVDGYRWHADPQAFAEDRRRDNSLRELGWSVYRTTAAELAEGARPLVRQLSTALGASRQACTFCP